MTETSRQTPRQPASYLTKPCGAQIAYHRTMGKAPGIVFLGGFASDMSGTKALAVEAFAIERGQAFLRFDYQGHGQSSGTVDEGTIGLWHSDAMAVLDAETSGPQILVGSSMGGWMMLLTAARYPDLVAGLVGIAPAPDFTEDLIWSSCSMETQEILKRDGFYRRSSEYSDEPYTITMKLIEDGRNNLVLRDRLAIDAPVRLLHGMADSDVPYQVSLRIADHVDCADLEVRIIKGGGHRLSTGRDLEILTSTIAAMIDGF